MNSSIFIPIETKKNNIFFINICYVLITIWAVALSSADLKSLLGERIHWIITPILLSPILIEWLYRAKIKFDIFSKSLLIFILTLSINVFFADEPSFTLGMALKLSIILATYIILSSKIKYLTVAYNGFIISAYANLAILLAGIFLQLPTLSRMMTNNRWMTVLNRPGTLCRAGSIVFIYSFYIFFMNRKTSWRYILLAISSITLVFFDGSRTDLLEIVIGFCFLFGIIYINLNKASLLKILYRLGTIIITLFITITVYNLRFSFEDFRLSNTLQFITKMFQMSSDFLQSFDKARYLMIMSAWNNIISHPLMGTGLYTSGIHEANNKISNSTIIDTMSVHNAYLEIWADFGLFPLLAFLALSSAWLFYLPKAMRYLKTCNDIYLQALYYNAIFLLFYFMTRVLFHPLSNEWAEWVIVIVPAGLFWHLIQSPEKILGKNHA